MKLNKTIKVELWLFIGSFLMLVYILLLNYVSIEKWDSPALIFAMELIIIPAVLLASFIPIIVVLRFIRKKTHNRTIAIITLFISLLTAFLLGYTSI